MGELRLSKGFDVVVFNDEVFNVPRVILDEWRSNPEILDTLSDPNSPIYDFKNASIVSLIRYNPHPDGRKTGFAARESRVESGLIHAAYNLGMLDDFRSNVKDLHPNMFPCVSQILNRMVTVDQARDAYKRVFDRQGNYKLN